MPTVETSIWLALKTHMQALSLSPAMPIAWPGSQFDPVNLAEYLQVVYLPNSSIPRHTNSILPSQRIGIFQINLMSKKNQDLAVSVNLAGSISAHFQADIKLMSGQAVVRITRADVHGGFATDTHWKTPISIYYEAFV